VPDPQAHHEPFYGQRPDVRRGDLVEVKTAVGGWVQMIAVDGPRYDDDAAYGRRVYLTVPVVHPHAAGKPGVAPINWPAEDVRAVAADG